MIENEQQSEKDNYLPEQILKILEFKRSINYIRVIKNSVRIAVAYKKVSNIRKS